MRGGWPRREGWPRRGNDGDVCGPTAPRTALPRQASPSRAARGVGRAILPSYGTLSRQAGPLGVASVTIRRSCGRWCRPTAAGRGAAVGPVPTGLQLELQLPADPLPFVAMQHSLAVIRTGRTPTRFVAPSASRRQPRMGLGRGLFAPASRLAPNASRRPLAELRGAARSGNTRHGTAAPQARHALGRSRDTVRWSCHLEGTLRHARPRSAAPWRA